MSATGDERVPGETAALQAGHAARVESLCEQDAVASPPLPGAGVPKGLNGPPFYRRAEVTLSWPISNMGPSLPNLMATVAGNLFELNPFSGMKLPDIQLSPSFLDKYQGRWDRPQALAS